MNTEEKIYDAKGVELHEGDFVHNKWGYDLIVSKDTDGSWYGKLVCEPGHACENIPYALCQGDIVKIEEIPLFKAGDKITVRDRDARDWGNVYTVVDFDAVNGQYKLDIAHIVQHLPLTSQNNYRKISLENKVNEQDVMLKLKLKKYAGGAVKIREQKTNILFLTDGSLVFNYNKFDDISEAIIDAVVNHDENLDEMLDLCYSQHNSHLKEYYLKKIQKYKEQHNIE